MPIELMMPSNHLILCCPFLLLPLIFPSIRVFSNESALCIRWPKYWSFSFSISHCKEYSGLTSFEIDWFDLLAFQGTLKSLLQDHSSKSSILRRSAFFIPPYFILMGQLSLICILSASSLPLWTVISLKTRTVSTLLLCPVPYTEEP